MAASSALLQMDPTLSRLQQSTIAPERLTVQNVGRKPVTPQRLEGEIIDPQVSVPMAKGNNPAEVAAADPADDPLDPCFKFQGFLVSPPNHLLL